MELYRDNGIVEFLIIFVRARIYMIKHNDFLRKAGVVKA